MATRCDKCGVLLDGMGAATEQSTDGGGVPVLRAGEYRPDLRAAVERLTYLVLRDVDDHSELREQARYVRNII